MAQTVKHTKVSGVPDGSDVNQVQPSDWNANHAITGTVDYSELSGTPNLALKADLASPTFTGDPKAPTPAAADSDTSIATTAMVHAAIAADVVRATTTEVLTGTDAAKVVTPDALAALWELGAGVTAAATTTLGEGGYFVISGNTGITDIDFATDKAGRMAWLFFTGTPLITHSGTLAMPNGLNYQVVGGDKLLFISEGSDAVRCLAITKADGSSVLSASTTQAGSSALATTTEVLTGTDAAKVVTPDALAALWEYTSIAVGTTITLTDGGFFNITGAAGVSISSIVFQTPKAGRSAWLWFVNAHTIVHGANLDCPGAQNLPVKDHDRVLITCTGASSYVVTAIERADGNIYFPATQQASSGANVLDDYEEGTWTPTIDYATTQPTGQTTNGSASYTRIGRFVHFEGRLTYTNKGAGGVGQLRLNGFPYAISGLQIASIDRYTNVTLPSSGIGMWMFITGSTFAEIHTRTNTACPPVNWSDVTNTTDFFFSGCYRTAT